MSHSGLHLLNHPLAQHLLTHLRDIATPPERFRDWARTLTRLLVFEATRDVPTSICSVQTPLEITEGLCLGQGLAAVPILRAGLAMLEPVTDMFPDVAVGYVGLERSHETAIARQYYCKLPTLDDRYCLCLDPMLATGGSAVQAIHMLKANGAKRIAMVAVVCAPEGLKALQAAHPEVPVYSAALDRQLNEDKYILPGLGDFGDRLYGTM